MDQNLLFITLCVAAYLLGSIPSAVWIGKIFFGIDVREHGSGNAGATNTLRTLGKPAGFTVLLLDFLKGFGAAQLVGFLNGPLTETELMNYKMVLGVMAVIGHVYPIFAGFRGGKGIATIIGFITAMSGLLALCCFFTFVIVVAITKYISLGSMVSALLSPIYVGFIYNWEHVTFTYFCTAIAFLILYTHRTNIGRLKAGTESKFSLNKKSTIETQKQ